MQVTQTSFTIAEYCDQMKSGAIVINRDYQRSDAVWPPAARSFLIDTILNGYPVPKFLLSQKTDLKTRKTIKQIVNGQQRSKAILDFYEGKLRLSGKGEFAGKKFSNLEEDAQQKFITYSISTDIFAGATEEEIREVFRRMNSYTVPLNHQEKRHATHQGEFKWFIIDLSKKYATSFKSIGVFTEKQLSRMQDASLLSELVMAFVNGIETQSQTKITAFYAANDKEFPEEDVASERIDKAMQHIFDWDAIHQTSLMKPAQFYTLFLAISHSIQPIDGLQTVVRITAKMKLKTNIVLANLGKLSQALDDDAPPKNYEAFVDASKAGTNTKINRDERFRFYCKAMRPELMP